MLRPHSTRRPWMAPGINRGSSADDSDHLREDVVAMFRDSFDDDGLDFLKRGPRTAQERLAYAQRVRPDAHLSAQPAPADVQRRFTDYGVIDRNRYFIGPDRGVYLRDEGSAELAPAATRRGFETAVGGFEPVSVEGALAELDSARADHVSPSSAVGGLDYLTDEQPVPPDARLTESAEQEIDRIERRYRDYVDYGRRHGHHVAADALEHFLSGSGATMRLDPSWLRSVPSVRAAEQKVLWYFTRWMTGHQKPEAAAEDIFERLLALGDGAVLQGGSTWTSSFSPNLLLEDDAFAALGQTNLKGTGYFTFRREGHRIHFDGTVRLVVDDNYDWEAGETGWAWRPDESFPWIERTHDDDAIKLQNHSSAQPFKLYSQWAKNGRGTMLIRGEHLTLEMIHWQDRQR